MSNNLPCVDYARIESIVTRLSQIFIDTHKQSGIVGVSGGVDSAASLSLAVKALGANNVFPVLLPYGITHSSGVLDAALEIERVGIPVEHVLRVDIRPAVDALVSGVKEFMIDPLRKGNMMARVRMTILFDQAKKRNGLVIGTENKTEHLLGYYTRFGDEASDVEPLRGLYKTQVFIAARLLGVSEKICTKIPSADLWEGQTDEKELGVSYAMADEILYRLVDRKMKEEVLLSDVTIASAVKEIQQRMSSVSFKSKAPYIIE